MSRIWRIASSIALIASLTVGLHGQALAHERRNVGPYQLVVGFLTEPAFAGTVNGVDLRVTDTRATPPKNVEGLQETVTVDVFHAGLTTPLSMKLRSRFGQPGAYAADFIPTQAGSYRFVFKGKIEQQDLNETFESGPGRFDEARDPADIQYPAKVPTGADLTERLDAIANDLRTVQVIAILALIAAIAFPLGSLILGRRPRA